MTEVIFTCGDRVTEAASIGRIWNHQIILTKEKTPKRCLANCLTVLTGHPAWDGVLAFDEFGGCTVALKAPPVRPQDTPKDRKFGDWTDEDSTRALAWFASEIQFEPTIQQIDQAIIAASHTNPIHPVRDYLKSLKWDEKNRVDSLFARYFGAAPSDYISAVGRCWLIASVARIFAPGCKVDSMVILEGPQGIGKSTALSALCGAEWFADTGIHIGDKDSYQSLRRKWWYEIGELSSIRGREIEKVKGFLSSSVDTYRAPYGRRTIDHPRQVVFAGTTNLEHYLNDPTGSRRFWPVKCGKIDLEAIKRDRDQLWAEAVVFFRSGTPWHLYSDALIEAAIQEQAKREERDDWIEIISSWLKSPTVPVPGDERCRDRIDPEEGLTTAQVLLGALNFSPERIGAATTKRAGEALRQLGYLPRLVRCNGSRVRRYFATCTTCDTTCDTSSKPNTAVVTGGSGGSSIFGNNVGVVQ